MNTIILNIGLDVSADNSPDRTPYRLNVDDVLAEVRRATGLTITSWQVANSDTEPTLVAMLRTQKGSSYRFHPAGWHMCMTLRQDAIAYTVNGEGFMVGPKAEAWGPFNPAYFLTFEDTDEGRKVVRMLTDKNDDRTVERIEAEMQRIAEDNEGPSAEGGGATSNTQNA